MSEQARQAREELGRWLGRAQRRGLLSPMQASQVKSLDLPLEPESAPVALPDDILQRAALELVSLARGKDAIDGDWQDALEIIAAWKLRTLLRVHEAAQDESEGLFAKWAKRLLSGALTLAAWHGLMQGQVQRLMAQQTVLGKRGLPSLMERAEAESLHSREQTFLQRFADDIAAKQATGQPLTEPQVRSRSNLYTGAARGEFYRGVEEAFRKQQGQPLITGPEAEQTDGWVVRYVCRGDTNSCQPCIAAQGWYMVGEGPLPGQLCEGRAQCRCRRVLKFDMDVWRRLISQG